MIYTLLALNLYIISCSTYDQTNQVLLDGTSSTNTTVFSIQEITWVANVSIGNPPQYFRVTVDTGSNLLWVPQQLCIFCPTKHRYIPNVLGPQQSYQPNGSVFYAQYGTGEASGVVATDLVGFNGSPINTTFTMMFATYESGFSFPDLVDGIMGLSNLQSFINIFQQSYSAGQISSPLYAIALNPLPLISYLLFDQIDTTLLNNTIWVDGNNAERWSLQINQITINGVDYSADIGNSTSGLIDTGTSCLMVTQELYNSLVDDFFAPSGCTLSNGFVQCVCKPTTITNMPNITIAFNQASVTIPYMNLIQGYYTAISDTQQCNICLFSISSGPMILGAPLLMSFIPIFNKEQNKIGLVGAQPNQFTQ